MALDVTEFQAAGLYRPNAPDAAERLALLEWLVAQGIALEQIVLAHREGQILSLAADLALRREEQLSLIELSRSSGMTVAELEQLRLAAGLPPLDAHTPAFSAADVLAFTAFIGAREMFGDAAAVQFSRVIGSSLGRLAEATVSLYLRTVEGRIREAGGDELSLARANLAAIQALESLRPVVHSMLRWHLETAIRRFREGRDSSSLETARMTVGFVDVVGFTPLSLRASTPELGAVVDRFEAITSDVTAAHDGRVVKLIGDAVMFVTVRAADACEIALTLMERFGADPVVTPRGGLASGQLLMRGGDYYGPTVNLASRISDLAVPNEILVSSELATEVPNDRFRFEPAGRRMLKGFDAPVQLFSVCRG
ncbi:MAG TPA: adenylate/guanylate cyclase domain-containing protein [Candidatus Binatia bacterium]|nr:adenylate/guanylate cyclase domain-containing protein [Candidatus Binatia bacterium]